MAPLRRKRNGSYTPKIHRAIRIRLQLGAKTRDLAMFNLAIDSKL
ncbi:Phage integrase family protein [Caballeronia sordidicola]|uniref:Phage integrase family protein n=1 Tax=Caballeronia sordidicola TaxID=196367 RepID=A0A242N446_CABSO|nr:Phage integrase family protein [Caballeronia sordidicola]